MKTCAVVSPIMTQGGVVPIDESVVCGDGDDEIATRNEVLIDESVRASRSFSMCSSTSNSEITSARPSGGEAVRDTVLYCAPKVLRWSAVYSVSQQVIVDPAGRVLCISAASQASPAPTSSQRSG